MALSTTSRAIFGPETLIYKGKHWIQNQQLCHSGSKERCTKLLLNWLLCTTHGGTRGFTRTQWVPHWKHHKDDQYVLVVWKSLHHILWQYTDGSFVDYEHSQEQMAVSHECIQTAPKSQNSNNWPNCIEIWIIGKELRVCRQNCIWWDSHLRHDIDPDFKKQRKYTWHDDWSCTYLWEAQCVHIPVRAQRNN